MLLSGAFAYLINSIFLEASILKLLKINGHNCHKCELLEGTSRYRPPTGQSDDSHFRLHPVDGFKNTTSLRQKTENG